MLVDAWVVVVVGVGVAVVAGDADVVGEGGALAASEQGGRFSRLMLLLFLFGVVVVFLVVFA